ncbi:glycogen debranching protein GlgX [Thorsellia kenyensis]|uniref:Glycogen debranching protein GlgX n=1 Tax=Thorsellia kenyensis TaxID=1549888 RepID=A0ABV6CCK4_9GAMM
MINLAHLSLQKGTNTPLGATIVEDGINFAVYSASAQYIELCLFDEQQREIRLPLLHKTGDIWHGFLAKKQFAGAQAGLQYGFRAFGPFIPQNGLRFNSQKLLLDPYAKKISGMTQDNEALYGGVHDLNHINSAPYMPKSIVIEPIKYPFKAAKPNHSWAKTILYEGHVKGLTKLHPKIPKVIQGTYAALAHPDMIKHYKSLGITAIELLPIMHHADEPRLQAMGLKNYWGYNTLGFFALDPSYASKQEGTSPEEELCSTIDTLHQEGIEVILDVVFNHTAELDEYGPTFSFKGLDNIHSYWLLNNGSFNNITGCGNTTNLQNHGMMNLVLDSLRYWIETFNIDGFRFDLATVLGRTPEFSPNAPLLEAMKNCPIISQVKLISEPWDVGSGGYQVGQFPAPFSDWNDKFRDNIRRFWLNHPLSLGEFAQAFAGSKQLFSQRDKPSASINFITAHDGFTLNDLVSYNQKYNMDNGENNRDGTSNNFSFNHGYEGHSSDLDVLTKRQVTQKSLLFTLLLSQGTPMLLAGDELNNSQNGNNNAYCQDNETTWLSWSTQHSDLSAWSKALVNYRFEIEAIYSDSWWEEGTKDVNWLNAEARSPTLDEWQSHDYPILQIQLNHQWLLVFNRSFNTQFVYLPNGEWHLRLDSNGLIYDKKQANHHAKIFSERVELPRGSYLFKFNQ